MRETIQVLGYYNKLNIGDDSYKICFPRIFSNYDFIFTDNPKKLETDIVILGGGDVFYPKLLDQLKNVKAKKKYACSVNLRPEMTEYYSMFDAIIARNVVDIKNAKGVKIHCLPDFAFALEGDKERGRALLEKLFTDQKAELYKDVVLVTMNAFLSMRENIKARDYIAFEKIAFELGTLIDNTAASFVFVPFGNGFPHNDRIPNSSVYSTCKWWRKNIIIYDTLSVQETLDLYTVADASIGTRLHAGIFSCIGETPFINIAHHSKTKMFAEFIGKPEWSIDYWHFSCREAMTLLNSFLKNKEKYKGEITVISQEKKASLGKLKDFVF